MQAILLRINTRGQAGQPRADDDQRFLGHGCFLRVCVTGLLVRDCVLSTCQFSASRSHTRASGCPGFWIPASAGRTNSEFSSAISIYWSEIKTSALEARTASCHCERFLRSNLDCRNRDCRNRDCRNPPIATRRLLCCVPRNRKERSSPQRGPRHSEALATARPSPQRGPRNDPMHCIHFRSV